MIREEFKGACGAQSARAETAEIENKNQTYVVKKDDINYPSKLLEYVSDCKTIYCRGDISLTEKSAVAVVGSRNCTNYGKAVAKEIGRKAAEYGVVLVSGLARGIDRAAHEGALEVGGKTIAVLGCGPDICYPSENRNLQKRIQEEGLIISEYPDGFKAKPYTFPMRNRLISGLSDAVAVVEAGVRSGSLITVECAAEQGKLVYAVPGNITSKSSAGTNKLIREAVPPLVIIDDVFLDMGIDVRCGICDMDSLGRDERKIMEVLLASGEASFEELYHKTHIKLQEINGIISILEIKGLVFCEMGKVFIAKF